MRATYSTAVIVFLALHSACDDAQSQDCSCLIPEHKLLTASDAAANDEFGTSVSIDGELLIVGSPFNEIDGITDVGSAYVYRSDGYNWVEEQQLVGIDPFTPANDWTGFSVDILKKADGNDLAILGAPSHAGTENEGGVAYIFRFNGQSWSQEAALSLSVAGDQRFGWSVALDVNSAGVERAVVGIPHFGVSAAGRAHVFKNNAGSWTLEDDLVFNTPQALEFRGTSVAIDDDVIVVGIPNKDTQERTDGGAIDVYRHDGTTWDLEQTFLGPHGSLMGTSVAVDDNFILAGAPADLYGSLSGAGFVRVFQYTGTTWVVEQSILDCTPEEGDMFGESVSISGGQVVVGAPGEDQNGIMNLGAAFYFQYYSACNPCWLAVGQISSASADAAFEAFGSSVAIGRGIAAVGFARDDHSQLTNPGTALVYQGFAPCDCTADLSGDGEVDAADLSMLLAHWGPCVACPADLNDDGDVGTADLAILLGAWGRCFESGEFGGDGGESDGLGFTLAETAALLGWPDADSLFAWIADATPGDVVELGEALADLLGL